VALKSFKKGRGLIKYVTKQANQLTNREYNLCMMATLQPASEMRIQLPKHRDDPTATIFMAFDGNQLAGWAMAHERSRSYNYSKLRTFYVYVKNLYRRLGIASILLGRACMGLRRPLYVAPWDDRSLKFYIPYIESAKVKVLPGYRGKNFEPKHS
jgi:hypothetical protein